MPDKYIAKMKNKLITPANISQIMDEELLAQIKTCPVRSFKEKTLLMAEGDPVAYLPIVVNGRLRVTRDDDSGREVLLYQVMDGETCVISLTSGAINEPSRVALTADAGTMVILIPSKLSLDWMDVFPEWRRFMFSLCHAKLGSLVRVIDSMSFQTTNERIIRRLEESVAIGQVELHMTHQQLAAELGTAREVVSRLLKKMEHEGKLKLFRGRILLHNFPVTHF